MKKVLAALFSLFVIVNLHAQAITEQTVYGFLGPEGSYPCSVAVSGNRVYGAALFGIGNSVDGTIFAVNTDGTAFTNLIEYSNSSSQTNGSHPTSVILSGNTLYGVASSGGTSGVGTVFSMATNGTNYVVLHSFNDTNSAGPNPNLLLSGNVFYGTTASGTVYKMNLDGSGYTNIYTFSDEVPNNDLGVYTNADGSGPAAGVILSGNTLYGTTMNGGYYSSGTIFRVNTDGTDFTNLYNFSFLDPNTYTNVEGANPEAPLLLVGNRLYGTANDGGTDAAGSVFSIGTGGQNFTNLYTFTGGNDGGMPDGGLTLVGNILYGTAEYNGANGSGTVFGINTNGTGFTNVYQFSANNYMNLDGANPVGQLVLVNNILYGTCSDGYGLGDGNEGTVFSLIFPDGTTPAAPELGIEMSGKKDVVFWPASATNFVLQTTPALLPVNWSTIATGIVTNGAVCYYTNTPSATAFFRLKQ